MKHGVQIYFLVVALCLGVLQADGQNISGIINQYAAVSAISTINCHATLTVDSAQAFSTGDSVLIIQMKGALIDSSNGASFGTILSLQDCGNYEIASVQAVSGNTITLNESLTRTYTVSGKVQLVKVPAYPNATISAPLTCTPWNGNKGGILALTVSNTLTFNSDINLDGKGFRGGTISNNPNGGCPANNTGYAFDLFLPANQWNNGGGAEKGESIVNLGSFLMGGRGPLASGGGGGNKHNTGGGGGGNFSSGGKGGNEMVGCAQNASGGIGGFALNYVPVQNKLFAGGGGGCGDINNAVGSTGTAGGGILVLHAQTIAGNGHTIFSRGLDQTVQATGIGDGAGGAGAGGTVLINHSNITGNLSIQVNGGHGGDQGPGSTYGCFGPGGGGGSGIVLSQSALPPSVSISNNPGTHGLILNTSLPCYGTPYGSTDGQTPAQAALTGYQIPRAQFISGTSLTVNLGPDLTRCTGQSVVLQSGYPGLTKLWNTGDTSTNLTITSSGTYIVQVTDALNCAAGWDTIQVVFISQPLTFSLGPDLTACLGQTVTLSSGFPALTHLWNNASTASTLQVSTSGMYFVTVSDTANCSSGSDTIQVTFINPYTFDLSNPSICAGDSIVMQAPLPTAQCTWSNGATTPNTVFNMPGTYWLRIQEAPCTDYTDTFTISILPPPDISPIGNFKQCVRGEAIQVSVQSNGIQGNLLWYDGSSSNPKLINDIGNFWVSLSNACGSDTSFFDIRDEGAASLFVPNAFTPNGDQLNDALNICTKAANIISEYYFAVYNRYGELVFESDRMDQGWNGEYKNQPAPQATYYWYLKGKTNCGKLFQKGDILLIR